MTVAVPVERYSPFPWKSASHLPCPDHQPYCCYHDESFVASDDGCDDVSSISPRYNHQSTTHATSPGNVVRSPLVSCPRTPLQTTHHHQTPIGPSSRSDCCVRKPIAMGGRSLLDEDVEVEYGRDEQTVTSCHGAKKRKLCEMLDDTEECGCRTPQEMTMVSETLQMNHGEAILRCNGCGPIEECCRCDPDDFFPDVSSEIELPMCYDGDDFKSRSMTSTSPDIMDNVIPDILPSCRTSDLMGMSEEDVEAIRACDRRRVLDMSLHKMRCIDDPEVSLRRSVLIANMVTKLRQEIRQEDYCRTVLPKKRRSYRRPWLGGPDRVSEPPCLYQGNQPRRRFSEDMAWEVYPSNEMLLNNGGRYTEHEDIQCQEPIDQCHEQIQTSMPEEERNSVLGDIDSIFQSLMACVGGP
ncbi:uncharacterized protein LOC129264075 [Lytechinus pictus]|uniref:uncharacterized protein LOC129264075 n=1 Tax=Lytechinus pictus TaxID=7653 RepID=UPI00240D3FD6|nr:uncharacterized protein LOC129264075 [Lytechinus pictus]